MLDCLNILIHKVSKKNPNPQRNPPTKYILDSSITKEAPTLADLAKVGVTLIKFVKVYSDFLEAAQTSSRRALRSVSRGSL